ncbi:MAG: sugar nucleotide-binding protein [Candidatus Eremiobacteraeota bacterium]|nr:sugar nucleotide-binding protein [Candidatus Eremiobacteraeota bacterium]
MSLELWGGVEPTVNRVGDTFFDQGERTGYCGRIDDIARFASLGIKALRFPILWERVERSPGEFTWRDIPARLEALRGFGIRPIATLLHHGSGPRWTNLLDPEFPRLFERFAHAVASRFPELDAYTPVNEPLTTARFSALYGHWYPHARDDRSFMLALLNQLRASVRAMLAIRTTNPAAIYVQTEDIGTTHARPRLAYQADFENDRRWLSLDLLHGKLPVSDRTRRWLTECGLDDADLAWFAARGTPPDLIGVNYYVTSERWLDERLERYPAGVRGGNGRDAYADVEAVRARTEGIAGWTGVLHATWERYRRPLAITEVHLGSTREEQMRWLWEAWRAANEARRRDIDVRAVTVWSLLGAFDWCSLVTRFENRYEPGAYDVRSSPPRPTALAAMMRSLAGAGACEHPVLEGPGWWRRPDRVPGIAASQPTRTVRPLLLAGAGGRLGRAFVRALVRRGISTEALDRRALDICDEEAVAAAVALHRPWAIVNVAGIATRAVAERFPDRARRVHVDGTANLAQAAARCGAALLTFSPEDVFDGGRRRPYVEGDLRAPIGVRGRTKAEAEERALEAAQTSLIVRTGELFGTGDDCVARRALRAGDSHRVPNGYVSSPTFVDDVVDAALDLLLDGETGIWHLANAGALDDVAFARRVLDAAKRSSVDIVATGAEVVPRPLYAALASERASLLSPVEDAIERWLARNPAA